MSQEDKFNVLTGSPEFRYMLLDRLRQDCLYYLGNGNRNETKLWTGNPKEQIKLMKDLYNSFEDKPQWISFEEINDLENKMLNDDIQENLNAIDSDPEIIHNYPDKQKSNKINESIDLLNQLKLINNQINEDNDNKFTKGSFVYYNKDPFLNGYGIITKILDDGTCEVDFKYTKFGAIMETERSGILLKDLKDGNQMIDKQIAKLQSQIDTQERIRKNCLRLK